MVHSRAIVRITERVGVGADGEARWRAACERFFVASRAAWAPLRAGDREAVQADVAAAIAAMAASPASVTVSWVRQPHAVEVWVVPDVGDARHIVRSTGLGGCDEGPHG